MATSELSEAPNKISFFSSIIHDLIEKYKPEKIAAITFALSSLLDRERTYVYSSPMVKGFDNIPLKSELEREFAYPIILEKDVNILQLYEIYKRQLPREGIVTGFYLGTGLGNSISIDGKVYVGNTGSACELGHIPLYGSTGICGCGKNGCIELKACGRVLEHLAEKIFRCPVVEIFQQYGSTSEIKEIIEYFALAIATEIGILDPRCVVLGGGVVAMPGFPKDLLIARIKSHVRTPYPRESLEFVFASRDSQAGIVGAVIHAKNKLHIF
jgi:allose kinase